MLAVALVMMMFAARDDGLHPAYVALTAEQMSQGEMPSDLSEGAQQLIRDNGAIAGRLGLTAYVVSEPPMVLFSSSDEADAEHQLYLVDHARRTFRTRFHLMDRNWKPLPVFHLMTQGTYNDLVDWVVNKDTYLKPWRDTALRLQGFTNAADRVVILESDLSTRELNRNNNIVHFVAHFSVFEHFGVQPFWVREGAALDLEVTVTDLLYNVCNNGSFAPMDRPGGWRLDVKKAFKRWRNLDPRQLVGLRQDHFDRDASLRALGMTRYCLKERPEEYAHLLGRFQADRDLGIDRTQNPMYMPGEDVQIALMADVLGHDWPQQAVDSLKKGDSKKEVKEEEGSFLARPPVTAGKKRGSRSRR